MWSRGYCPRSWQEADWATLGMEDVVLAGGQSLGSWPWGLIICVRSLFGIPCLAGQCGLHSCCSSLLEQEATFTSLLGTINEHRWPPLKPPTRKRELLAARRATGTPASDNRWGSLCLTVLSPEQPLACGGFMINICYVNVWANFSVEEQVE